MRKNAFNSNYICDNNEKINRFFINYIQMKFVIFIIKYLWYKILTETHTVVVATFKHVDILVM